MAKVCKYLLLRCVCAMLNAELHLARDARPFVCAILGFVCKVLKNIIIIFCSPSLHLVKLDDFLKKKKKKH